MSINIGDNNKIENSTISDNSIVNIETKQRKNWAEKHPLIIGIIVAVVAGLILELAFWDEFLQFLNSFLGA